MGKPRMIQGQFGTVQYTTGIIDPLTTRSNTEAVQYIRSAGNTYLGVTRRNDKFYLPNKAGGSNDPLQNGIHFCTYDYVDLRDLMEEKACLDDVTINIQRLRELPYPDFTYNMAPGNIEETFLIILGDIGLDHKDTLALQRFHYAGFSHILDTDTAGLPFEVLYRENRQYVQDPSQNFQSPDQIGSQAGPLGDPAQAPTRFVGNYRLQSRTIGGYPDLVVGPGLTIMRVVSVWPGVRSVQSLTGGNPGDTAADEFTYLQSQVMAVFPALQYNIVGTQRPLTATETATYYSNILLNQG
jgi:hypothetical protein